MNKCLVKSLLLALIIIFIFFFSLYPQSKFRVKRVIDGDTIVLDNDERVRLIGVDTPEIYHPLKPLQYFSEEATNFTKQIVEGKQVILEFDCEKIDKYGRLLAYVFLEDGTFLNKEIIIQGYGFAYTKYPFKYLNEFVEAENEARISERGLWRENGIPELKWLIKQNRVPFLIYEMSNNLWCIEYKNYAMLRINTSGLSEAIDSLRVWVNEFEESDLYEKLNSNGWKKIK